MTATVDTKQRETAYVYTSGIPHLPELYVERPSITSKILNLLDGVRGKALELNGAASVAIVVSGTHAEEGDRGGTKKNGTFSNRWKNYISKTRGSMRRSQQGVYILQAGSVLGAEETVRSRRVQTHNVEI